MKKLLLLAVVLVSFGIFTAPKAEARVFIGIGLPVVYPAYAGYGYYGPGPYYGGYYGYPYAYGYGYGGGYYRGYGYGRGYRTYRGGYARGYRGGYSRGGNSRTYRSSSRHYSTR